MLVLSCIALCLVNQAHQDALIMSVSAMLRFLPSLKPVNETCYVYMLAIISSGPFWLMVSKGLLLYAFIRILTCLVLPC